MTRNMLAVLAATSLVAVGGCKKVEPEAETTAAAVDSESQTLATALASAPHLSTLSAALKDTGLSGALEGGAPYTLIAPADEAFAGLGDAAAELRKPEQRAVMAEILREHVIPGYLTPRDIEASIAAHQGKPVTMRTAGDGKITFARQGDTLTVTSSDGVTARVAGEVVRARNGSAIPIDAVLKKLPPA